MIVSRTSCLHLSIPFRFIAVDATAIMIRRAPSHTQQEWDNIKPDFTELYMQQHKKLKQVAKILEARGFLARLDH